MYISENKQTANARKALENGCLKNDEIFLLLGQKFAYFQEQALWFEGGCQSETICQKGELMCHQTERRTVLFVMNQNRVGCELQYMDVTENNGTIYFNRVFHYKPSILGYPYFWKHPHGKD